MKLIPKEKIIPLLSFNKGAAYILLMIARKKDNQGFTNSDEIVFRAICNSEDDFKRKYDQLVNDAKNRKENYKFYITFNPKDILQGYRLLKEKFTTWDYELTKCDIPLNRIKNIHNEWISCLQKSCLKKKYFMLDVDTKDIYEIGIIYNAFWNTTNLLPSAEKDSDDITIFHTQNGSHWLFPVCDTRALLKELENIDCELKRDALLCIGYYKNEN